MGKKYFTLSFDDGIRQDVRCMEILKKYAIKATFNVNSGLLGLEGTLDAPAYYGGKIRHDKMTVEELRQGVYDGFEVACHTMTHPLLPALTDAEVLSQLNGDYRNLSDYCGIPPVGMAYPCAHPNYDERVANLVKTATPLKYARTIVSTGTFKRPESFFTWHPTTHVLSDDLPALTKTFLTEAPDEDLLFYVWGHSYEFDIGTTGTWQQFEDFCKTIANHKDVIYITNGDYVNLQTV